MNTKDSKCAIGVPTSVPTVYLRTQTSTVQSIKQYIALIAQYSHRNVHTVMVLR